ncbi:VOC family protein [Oceanibium sediminis]|uniref:VOC family protein n=1 Tax=Oceanibium sediminis TaxID=2026339 RepID=UPI000DD49837|nr:VOC family protein [Oceanibium sediminis]
MKPEIPAKTPAPSGMHVGHVHLRVADLERSIRFYKDVLGLDVMQHYGDRAAFLSADGYHHHLGLNTWESAGGTPPPRGHTGLYHAAFVYADRKALGTAVARVVAAGVKLEGAADHGVSEAVYLSDPDGNGLELYRDRPPQEWPVGEDGHLKMVNDPLDVAALIAEAE